MSYFGSTDWLIQVNRGLVPGHELVHKFGWRGNASTAHAHVWNSPTVVDLIWATATETIDLVSDDANDTAAGTGARSVFIEGLDANFDTQTETIALSGLTPVTTVNSYIRIQRAWVVDVGVYGGTGIGTITISGTTTTNPYAYIESEDAQTENTQYTVPAGKTGYILKVSASVEANKEASLSFHRRSNADDNTTAPFTSARVIHLWNGVIGTIDENFLANHIMPEKTDLYFDAEMSSGTGIVQIDYDILLVDN